MPKYTFEWSKTTTYTTIVEADSEADANADLLNDITANQTDFASDITDEVFDVPEEASTSETPMHFMVHGDTSKLQVRFHVVLVHVVRIQGAIPKNARSKKAVPCNHERNESHSKGQDYKAPSMLWTTI